MSDSEDNERVNEISRALQSMLDTPLDKPKKTVAKRARKSPTTKRPMAKKPTARKVDAKVKPTSTRKKTVKPQTAAAAEKTSNTPKSRKAKSTSKPDQIEQPAAKREGQRLTQSTDFALLAQRLRQALDDVKTGRVPTANPTMRSFDVRDEANHQLITSIRTRMDLLSDEIDNARAQVAQKLLALDNMQRRMAFEIDDLLDQLSQRLDKDS